MDFGLCELIGLAMVLSPPLLVCWTVAALGARNLNKWPIGLRDAWEAFTAGVLIGILLLFPAWLIALLVAAVTFVPLLLANSSRLIAIPEIVPVMVAAFAAFVAVLCYWWRTVWPIAVAEWKRLTSE